MSSDPVTLESLASDLQAVKAALRTLGGVVEQIAICRGNVGHVLPEMRNRLVEVARALGPPPAAAA